MAGRVAERKIKRLTVMFSDGAEERTGTTSDLSHTGIFIRTRKIFKPGTHLNLTIEVDDNNKINLTGRVARYVKLGTTVFKDGMGVHLTSIPQGYKDLVDKLISQ